ncbi:hypothetical protein ADU80_08630 [Clostridium botulinum]|uniref:Uncharacterized protein n=1 Tax=Clostridium botulinum TaxID=1491 RepID=A0A9Q1UZM9_CLOBO|nr:hypothetical protein [Clostridium botulinum]AEB76482.1 hypothetical protein CbC4_1808 [Clostridium botulinum BKT015925]KEI03435.1 hypothetical protein Y848_04680 [Clostridium botulinum C/D str. Sp77]KOA74069.1 hypothetical protein ADU77_12940 [Clostridium botulinum]KOA84889.1 hypothetical protein ADU80_08630 [Clostridium botulinum]KOA88045.1 hypothetical protein ADU75_03085 [Clostridium botulinum]
MITNDNVFAGNQGNGFINISNHGAFVASCHLGYKSNGQSYFQSANYLPVLQSKLFTLPKDATGIVLQVDCWIDFSVSTTMCIEHFNSVVQKCFYLWGTVAYNGCSEIPCSGNGGNGGNPTPPTPTPPCCCCCCKC